MSRLEIDGFFTALYRDAHVKNRIILWTFVLLVFPAALLLALGVPARPTYTVMFLLLLPLQFVIYRLSGRKAPAEKVSAGVPLHPTQLRVITQTIPDIDAAWAMALNGKQGRHVAQVLLVDANVVLAWQESLRGDSEQEKASPQSASSLDPQLQAMLGKSSQIRMSQPLCFNT